MRLTLAKAGAMTFPERVIWFGTGLKKVTPDSAEALARTGDICFSSALWAVALSV